jgi:hypothetical protein
MLLLLLLGSVWLPYCLLLLLLGWVCLAYCLLLLLLLEVLLQVWLVVEVLGALEGALASHQSSQRVCCGPLARHRAHTLRP